MISKVYFSFMDSVKLDNVNNLPLKTQCIAFCEKKNCSLKDYLEFISLMSKYYLKSKTHESLEEFVKNLLLIKPYGVSLSFDLSIAENKNIKEKKNEKTI